MSFIDVFNGDADGICALIQLHLDCPRTSTLVTGVKRDIALLDRVTATSGDTVTVLDISMDKNRSALERLLESGVEVKYFDHHYSGDIPDSARLDANINTAADVCTSLLVNGHLKGKYAEWALVGAYGDNLKQSAIRIAKQCDINTTDLEALENLGIYINYNGYGSNLEDLHYRPEDLFKELVRFKTPQEFISSSTKTFNKLKNGYEGDMHAAGSLAPFSHSSKTAVYVLPDAPWARRVSGVFSNDLTNQYPQRAHAVLTEKPTGSYLVSIRAPLENKSGADELCRMFPTGGGRAGAAGINDLEKADLDRFLQEFEKRYG